MVHTRRCAPKFVKNSKKLSILSHPTVNDVGIFWKDQSKISSMFFRGTVFLFYYRNNNMLLTTVLCTARRWIAFLHNLATKMRNFSSASLLHENSTSLWTMAIDKILLMERAKWNNHFTFRHTFFCALSGHNLQAFACLVSSLQNERTWCVRVPAMLQDESFWGDGGSPLRFTLSQNWHDANHMYTITSHSNWMEAELAFFFSADFLINSPVLTISVIVWKLYYWS